MTLVGNRALKLSALLLAGLGLISFLLLIKLRFDAGDSMPHGSSLRSDPLGVEVLFESLNSSGLVSAERNFFTLKQAKLNEVDMLVFSCFIFSPWGSGIPEIQNFVTNRGGRVLFTLPPKALQHVKPPPRVLAKQKKKPTDKEEDSKGKKDLEDKEDHEDKENNRTNVLWRAVDTCNLPKEATVATLNPDYDAGGYELPETLPLKTAVGLNTNLLDASWQIVYACGDIPVVVEYRSGAGSIVLSALSYPFSNEAMRSNRETGFLLWVFGDSKKILFDESHFGLVSNRTVAKLIRKNNLHYSLLAMMLPCLLYFWLAGVPLIPRYTRIFDLDAKSNNSSGSALSKLLKRSIPPKELMPLALEAWIKANPVKLGTLSPDARKELEALLALNHERARKLPRATHITAAYNDVVAFMRQHEL